MQKLDPSTHKPWQLVRVLSDDKLYPVTSFFNRQDAEDTLRQLKRLFRDACFKVISKKAPIEPTEGSNHDSPV